MRELAPKDGLHGVAGADIYMRMSAIPSAIRYVRGEVVVGEVDQPVCGIIMPISAIDNCTEEHWAEVLAILGDAIHEAGFEPNIVSNADDVGVIQKRIIQNLYDNPVVVCDVSGKNPNVMFELGVRLAFDRPTIIVKDDKTSFSFDTHAIEHIEYPRDLRFAKIVDFKLKLAEKISATHKKATLDPNYTTFLKHFGEFTVAKLDKKEVSTQAFILEELKSIQQQIRRLDVDSKANLGRGGAFARYLTNATNGIHLDGVPASVRAEIAARLNQLPGIAGISYSGDFITYAIDDTLPPRAREGLEKKISLIVNEYRGVRQEA